MLESIKQAGKSITREINRAWENLSEGWRELLSRSSEALTHFVRGKDEEPDRSLATFPRWSLLSGEVEETASNVVVRVEVPGMEKEDWRVSVEGNMLYLSGENASNARHTTAPTTSWSVLMAHFSAPFPCPAM